MKYVQRRMCSSGQILQITWRIFVGRAWSREASHANESHEIGFHCWLVPFVSLEFGWKRTSMVGLGRRILGADSACGLGNRPHGGGSDHSRPQILLGGRILRDRSAFQSLGSSDHFSLDISHLGSGLYLGFCPFDSDFEDGRGTRLDNGFLISQIARWSDA